MRRSQHGRNLYQLALSLPNELLVFTLTILDSDKLHTASFQFIHAFLVLHPNGKWHNAAVIWEFCHTQNIFTVTFKIKDSVVKCLVVWVS